MSDIAKSRLYVEHAPFGIFIADCAGRYLEVNPAAVTLTGYTEAELLAMTIPDLLTPRSLEDAQAAFQHLVEHGAVTDEYEFRRKDGTLYWVSLNAVRLSPERFMGYCLDITERKRAEAALQQSEERFAQITAQSGELIWEVDPEGLYAYVSRACLALLGYSMDEVVGKLHFYDLHPEEGRAAFREAALQAFEQRLTFTDLENSVVCKNGRVIEVLTNGVPFFDEQGVFRGYRGSDKDITAIKRAEEEVQRERQRGEEALRRVSKEERVILDTVAVGIGFIKNRKTQWANSVHDAMLGYAAGATVGLDTAAFYASRDEYDRVGREGYAQLATGGAYTTEVEMKRTDGTVFWCSLAGRAVDSSSPDDGAIWILQDTTERKRAEMVLRKLSRAVEASPASIVITDRQGHFEYVNPKFCQVTGYSFDEICGRNPRVLKSGQNPPELYQQLWATITQGREWRGEFSNRKKSGEIFWEFASISPIRGSDGQITHFVAVKEDITARKRAEEELLETNQSLEQATARANQMALQAELASIAKSDFLANMSHELRTPMNGLLGLLSLLLDTNLTADQRQYAQIARNSGQALLVLLNDLLDYSKIEARKLTLETLDFDLFGLLDEFLGTMAPRAHEKGLVLGCLAAPEVPSALRGDPGRLRQILLNLAGNAIKFTSRGEVVIRVSVVADDPREVRLRFAVQDTGIGIPEDKRGLLFTKFSQVDSSTTRFYGGTGLGLAISKQLAELMGGEIGVRSEADHGSEFWFTVRLVRQPSPATVAPLSAELRGVRILIAEGHRVNREILRVLLQSWGLRCAEVPDGPSALRALAQAKAAHDPFTIAFLDAQIPGQEGEALGRAIKTDATLKETRLVMLTVLGHSDRRSRWEEIGFLATLTKPVRRQELKQVLEAAISGAPTPALQASATPNFASGHASSQARILIAEDNRINQQVAVGLLKKLGLSAEVVANGLEAVQALETVPYDLVFMDVQMPEMDGFQATRVIRDPHSQVLDHLVPIIAMTAHAMQGDRERCLEAGMDDYVSKPIEVPALAAALAKWLTPLGENQPPRAGPAQAAPPASIPHKRIPVFDRAGFMDRVTNDTEFARVLIEAFLEDMPGQMKQLRSHVAAGDARRVEQMAHKLKGASAAVGGEAFRAVASDMEEACKAGDLTHLSIQMAELDAQLAALKNVMEEEL